MDLHHVVYQQRVRAEHGDLHDPRNSLTLCRRCHEAHHQRSQPLRLKVLRNENYDFAVELLGVGAAFNYLSRRYAADGDPRLEMLSGFLVAREKPGQVR